MKKIYFIIIVYMSKSITTDIFIWILLIFILLIILGLYLSDGTPLDKSEREAIKAKMNDVENAIETFVSRSDVAEQAAGASEYYAWGLPNEVYEEEHRPVSSCSRPVATTTCNFCNTSPCGCGGYKKEKYDEVCKTCDITNNKDIDKYVLKSSVPPCPDMSNFVAKNQMNSCPDLKDYVLKSEIKACEKVDMNQYIKKSEIPPCPTCPTCPECPVCPVCPKPVPPPKCKQIYEYAISEHPDFSKYQLKSSAASTKKVIQEEEMRYGKVASTKQDAVKTALEDKKKYKQQIAEEAMDKKQNYKDYIKSVFEEEKMKLKGPDMMGYYAGDSLYAAF